MISLFCFVLCLEMLLFVLLHRLFLVESYGSIRKRLLWCNDGLCAYERVCYCANVVVFCFRFNGSDNPIAMWIGGGKEDLMTHEEEIDLGEMYMSFTVNFISMTFFDIFDIILIMIRGDESTKVVLWVFK